MSTLSRLQDKHEDHDHKLPLLVGSLMIVIYDTYTYSTQQPSMLPNSSESIGRGEFVIYMSAAVQKPSCSYPNYDDADKLSVVLTTSGKQRFIHTYVLFNLDETA